MPGNDRNESASWVQYQKLVLAELERHSSALEDINHRIASIQVEIAMLKVKSGIWGLMGGLIPVIIAFAMAKLK